MVFYPEDGVEPSSETSLNMSDYSATHAGRQQTFGFCLIVETLLCIFLTELTGIVVTLRTCIRKADGSNLWPDLLCVSSVLPEQYLETGHYHVLPNRLLKNLRYFTITFDAPITSPVGIML
jgi:hypothetical protein